MILVPWKSKALRSWSIIGMNHYYQDGDKRLFVSMGKQGRFIKNEGADDVGFWKKLESKAKLWELI